MNYLLKPLPIIRETDKAVSIPVDYTNSNLPSSMRAGAAVWLPKSQITIDGEHVVAMAQWLADKHGLLTQEGAAASQARMDAGTEKYNALVELATARGIKIRAKSKKQKVVDALYEAGVSFAEMIEALAAKGHPTAGEWIVR